MQRLKDELTLVMVRASDGYIVEKARSAAGGYFKFCYHAKCYPLSSSRNLLWRKVFYMWHEEVHKPHWSKRRCMYCQRYLLAGGPPSD